MNVRYGNTFYIDSQYASPGDALTANTLKLKGIIFTPTATSGAELLLTDNGNNKLQMRGDSTGRVIFLNLSGCPITFTNSIRPTTLTNAMATCIIEVTNA